MIAKTMSHTYGAHHNSRLYLLSLIYSFCCALTRFSLCPNLKKTFALGHSECTRKAFSYCVLSPFYSLDRSIGYHLALGIEKLSTRQWFNRLTKSRIIRFWKLGFRLIIFRPEITSEIKELLFSSPRAVHAQRLTTDLIRSWRTQE